MNGRTVKAIIILLSVLAVSFAGIGVLKNRNAPPPEISGGSIFPDGGNGTGCQPIHDPTQVFVYDVTDGVMKFRQGTDRKIVPASVTKLLTALTALDMMPENTVITPGDELKLVAAGSSVAYIKAHHRLTLAMLVEGMLLPSGNDAAYVTAAGAARYATGNRDMSGRDAVDYFMAKVNEYAVKIGCTGTHFTVPDGLAYEGHYTTADDLVIIAEKALENPVISRCAVLLTDSVKYASGHTNEWHNTNLLINPDSDYYRSSVTGLKTGSLTDAYSVVVIEVIDGKTYIIGVFSARYPEDRYIVADRIIDGLSDKT